MESLGGRETRRAALSSGLQMMIIILYILYMSCDALRYTFRNRPAGSGYSINSNRCFFLQYDIRYKTSIVVVIGCRGGRFVKIPKKKPNKKPTTIHVIVLSTPEEDAKRLYELNRPLTLLHGD